MIMIALNVFMYIWLILLCCMCSRLCYEEQQQRHPDNRFNCNKIKKKLCPREPLIEESELTESICIDNDEHDDDDIENTPPRWVNP